MVLKKMLTGRLGLPAPKPLPNDPTIATPFVILGDDAFPLGTHLLKPHNLQGISYQQHVFNYRLSRARRMVENVFGILANRFRIFLGPIDMVPKYATLVSFAALTLHNLLRAHNPQHYLPPSSLDQENTDGSIRPGSWREQNECMECMSACNIKNSTVGAKKVRQTLTEYFSTKGAVAWQDRALEIIRRRPLTE